MRLITQAVGHGDAAPLQALRDNEQLTACLATGAAFPGFQELALPTFAPTYKKKVELRAVGET